MAKLGKSGAKYQLIMVSVRLVVDSYIPPPYPTTIHLQIILDLNSRHHARNLQSNPKKSFIKMASKFP